MASTEHSTITTAANTGASIAWIDALSSYQTARDISDRLDPDAEGADAAVDDYCVKMDKLLALRAPGIPQVLRKLELIRERFGEPCLIPEDVVEALEADIRDLNLEARPSLILQLNERYEQAFIEYNRLDEESFKLGNPAGDPRKWRIEEAMQRLHREQGALRLALLHQVPTCWDECVILLAHAHSIGAFEEGSPSEEREAHETAVDTALDFMFGELDLPELANQQLGHLMQIVRGRRLLRTGNVEAA